MHQILTFVNIFIESHLLDEVIQALSSISNVIEIYEVTGEFDIVTLVSASDIEELRDVLNNKILRIPGVKSTVSSIALQVKKGTKCTV
jgi:DNA-binding Lrp family transcriptional regulator